MFCDFQIEKQIANVRTAIEIFSECRKELSTDALAGAAVACKEKKFKERGIETERVGSVDGMGNVRVEEWPGPCGPIFYSGVSRHEAVHLDYIARRQKSGEENPESIDLSEVGARDFCANEIKAYKHEQKFLQHVLDALAQRCTPGETTETDPDYLLRACGELDLEMGLDWSRQTSWRRREVEDSWPGLKGKCWWYLGGPGGSYNCYGYALREVFGELKDEQPGLESLDVKLFDDYFDEFGYRRTERTGDIALYSKSHVARRSDYRFAGGTLWESKLSAEAPLILHELKDIEGDAFGKVIAYYSRVNR